MVSVDSTRATMLQLIPDKARVLAAVSGGADSLALLLLLRQCRREVIVAHINHQTRGAASEGDQQFVEQVCREQAIACVSRRVQVLAGRGNSFEMAARQARYAALIDIARAQNCAVIATGHTADDQLETVLLHWLRGAAIDGLRGIEAERDIAPQLKLLRPLLGLTREGTVALCEESGLRARFDVSNDDPKYLRNRVRHELVPLLETLMNAASAPGRLARQTHRATEILRDDFALLDELAARALESLSLHSEAKLLVLDGAKLVGLPPSLQRRVLRLASKRLGQNGIAAGKIDTVRCWVAHEQRRAVWMWTRRLQVEWTGIQGGQRIRLQGVGEELGTLDGEK